MDSIDLEDKILGSIYGLIIGDVLGEPFEGLTKDKIRDMDIDLGDRIYYTDDTVLSLIVASSLIKNKGVNRTDIAKSILKNRDYIPKMGPTTLLALSHFEKGNMDYFPKSGTTNGAAMRAPPIGWVIGSNNIEELCKNVYLSSSVTHGTSVAISGACAVAEAVSTAIDGYNLDRILKNALQAAKIGCKYGIKDEHNNNLLINRIKSVSRSDKGIEYASREYELSIETVDTVPLVFKSLSDDCDDLDFKGTMIKTVSLGGDTDTISALTGSILGAMIGLSGIPPSWKDKINRLDIILADGKIDLKDIGTNLALIRKRFFEDS